MPRRFLAFASAVDRTGAVLFLGHVADPTDAGSP